MNLRHQLLLVSLITLNGCSTKVQDNTSVHPTTNVMDSNDRSIKSYMAEMEQYLNDVYRFYDDPEMRETLLERIGLILEFHDQFIDSTPEVFNKMPPNWVTEYKHLYRYHVLKSKRLFSELKTAIEENNFDQVEKVLDQLDENRRNSHTIFG
ncbi:hypothetical protein [Rubellicoccus peritrichatus]|uniref:Uncharacterized protein n=1 Tax=Rubellicoccus peritrichatus TaxID=3080537 RepID=A0AAQ3L6J0_9BACT|nr:hypothetical protein [Puniceicoccus sp. CR14]WOO40235.1 hypothetical protein RZN69_16565 [Puniceicoccus sp. CR14]